MRGAAVLLALAAATPAGADALQDRVLAGMKGSATADVAFTQTIRIERTGSAAKLLVTRYDPRATPRWTLASVDGRAPTAKESADTVKQATKAPLPAYARLARWFGAPATRVAEGAGTVTYRFAHLPKGTLLVGSHDASADTVADAVVNLRGPVPYVERVRFETTTPFRMMLVARVERMVVTASYAPLPDGRIFPAGTDSDTSGSMMGKSGSFRTHTRYTDLRPAR